MYDKRLPHRSTHLRTSNAISKSKPTLTNSPEIHPCMWNIFSTQIPYDYWFSWSKVEMRRHFRLNAKQRNWKILLNNFCFSTYQSMIFRDLKLLQKNRNISYPFIRYFEPFSFFFSLLFRFNFMFFRHSSHYLSSSLI